MYATTPYNQDVLKSYAQLFEMIYFSNADSFIPRDRNEVALWKNREIYLLNC